MNVYVLRTLIISWDFYRNNDQDHKATYFNKYR